MFTLIIAGVIIVAGIVVYKLWKANKAVTGKSVVAGVESTVKTAVNDVKSTVAVKGVDSVVKSVESDIKKL
jgi:hypothetical protein